MTIVEQAWEVLKTIVFALWLVAIYLVGFKIFRWVVSIGSGLLWGAIGAVITAAVAANNGASSTEDFMKVVVPVFFLAGAIGFALAHYFQQVGTALFGAITSGGICYMVLRIYLDSDGPHKVSGGSSVAATLAVLVAIAAAVLVLYFYDYFAGVWLVSSTIIGDAFSTALGHSGIGFKSLVEGLLSGDLFKRLLAGGAATLWSFVAAIGLASATVIWLRYSCWSNPQSRASVRLKPELRPFVLVTASLLVWDVFWSRELPISPLGSKIEIWPAALLAYQQLVLPKMKVNQVTLPTDLRLPDTRWWIWFAAITALGVPLATSVLVFFQFDTVRLALATGGSVTLPYLGNHFAGYLPLSSQQNFAVTLRWLSVGLFAPVLLDWARRRSQFNGISAAIAAPLETVEPPDDLESEKTQPASSSPINEADAVGDAHSAEMTQLPMKATVRRKMGISAIGVLVLLVVGLTTYFLGRHANRDSQLSDRPESNRSTRGSKGVKDDTPLSKLSPTSFAASSYFASGTEQHPPEHAFDGNPDTAWNESWKQPDRGAWLEARFDGPRTIRQIRIATGYDATSAKYGDLFTGNRHAKHLTIWFDGGSPLRRDVAQLERQVTLDKLNVTASMVRIAVDDTYPGSRWQQMCISEVQILGGGMNDSSSREAGRISGEQAGSAAVQMAIPPDANNLAPDAATTNSVNNWSGLLMANECPQPCCGGTACGTEGLKSCGSKLTCIPGTCKDEINRDDTSWNLHLAAVLFKDNSMVRLQSACDTSLRDGRVCFALQRTRTQTCIDIVDACQHQAVSLAVVPVTSNDVLTIGIDVSIMRGEQVIARRPEAKFPNGLQRRALCSGIVIGNFESLTDIRVQTVNFFLTPR